MAGAEAQRRSAALRRLAPLLGLAQLPQRALALVARSALQDQHAVEVVHLVLDHARLEAGCLDQALLALLVERAHADVDWAVDIDGHAGDRQAALLAELLVAARPFEQRVRQYRQRRVG